MSKKILLGVLAAAALAMVVPTMASASTAIPSLPTGDTQAFIADSDGNPESDSITLTGPLSLAGGVTINCDNHFVIDFSDDGTGTVTSFTASNCAVENFPNCVVDITPENLDWGVRFVKRSGVYRALVNANFIVNFTTATPNCPVQAPITESGILSPSLSISGTTITAGFGAGSGSVSGALGTATVNGSLTGTVGAGTQLIP